MKKCLTAVSVAVLGCLLSGGASAYVTTFAEDLHNNPNAPLIGLPNSTAAEGKFLGDLTGARVEDFEGQPGCTGASNLCTAQSLTLSFQGSGGVALGATLSGGGGYVRSVAPGTSESGRHSVPSSSSRNFWRAEASTSSSGNPFMLSFDSDVAAFGFYGVDIGDFGGQVSLELVDGAGRLIRSLTVPNTDGAIDSDGDGEPDTPSDGSVLYFGVKAQTTGELFRGIRFRTSSNSPDVFAFDNFTIVDACQAGLCPPGGNAPEPGSLALAGLALLALGAVGRRKL